jgi:hypothetical protein
MDVDTIPVAHTPAGGFGDTFPPPVLSGCPDELADQAPDMRGVWQVVEVIVDGEPVTTHRMLGSVQRIEQAGDRVVVTAAGVVHDMRCDGTEAHGVNDVAEFDKATPINVVATFENGVHVLRPVGIPVEVKRWRVGAELMWQYVGFTARLVRLGPPDMAPPTGAARPG